jgi:hypothetical protein
LFPSAQILPSLQQTLRKFQNCKKKKKKTTTKKKRNLHRNFVATKRTHNTYIPNELSCPTFVQKLPHFFLNDDFSLLFSIKTEGQQFTSASTTTNHFYSIESLGKYFIPSL